MPLFDSVDRHYARYRPGLPEEVVQLLAKELDGLDEPRLLDLGAGTGQVALALTPAVLAMADRVAAPHAAVAVMGDGSLWTHDAEWTAALKGLIQSHLGEDRRAGTTGAYREPGRRYEDELADSAFSDVTEHRALAHRHGTSR